VEIPAELDSILAGALEARNYLTHRFFADHSEQLMSESGRVTMIEKLRKDASDFTVADRRLDEVGEPYFRRLGMTPELVAEEFEKMMSNAEQPASR
jgi:hypothetical protein